MLRKLVGNFRNIRPQTFRQEDISRFVCLRAQLNQNYEQSYLDLAKQYNLSPQELTLIAKIGTLDLVFFNNIIQKDVFLRERENCEFLYRQWKNPEWGSLEEQINVFDAKYPQLQEKLAEVDGFKEAHQDLQNFLVQMNNIYVPEQQSYSTDLEQNRQLQEVFEKYVRDLQAQHPQQQAQIREIQQSLDHLLSKFSENDDLLKFRVFSYLLNRNQFQPQQMEQTQLQLSPEATVTLEAAKQYEDNLSEKQSQLLGLNIQVIKDYQGSKLPEEALLQRLNISQVSQIAESASQDQFVEDPKLLENIQNLQQAVSIPNFTRQGSLTLQERQHFQFDPREKVMKEINQEQNRQIGFNSWFNDKKLIFEAQIQNSPELRYYVLALLCGVSFAYFLYSGDAKYKTLLLTPLVGAASGLAFRRSTLINQVPKLKELYLHRDGRTVDAVLQSNAEVFTKNNIPINQIKLFRNQEWVKGDLQDIKALIAQNGQWLQLGDTQVLVPSENTGNRQILSEIFRGQDVVSLPN